MWTTINALLQTLGTLLVRLSACLLVLRMPPVGHTKQLHARAIHMLMVFFVLISTASFFLLCFHCTPIESLWDRTIHARCISMQTWCTIQKVDGSKSWAFMNAIPQSLLTGSSLPSSHELPDCQSPVRLLTKPPDSSEGEVGSHDHCLLSLLVSGISLGGESLGNRISS